MALVHIVDYGMGNLRSVSGAIRYLGHEPVVCRDPSSLLLADRVILPGVGAFGQAMANLAKLQLIEPLSELALHRERPVLGICLGGQLLCKDSEEFGLHKGLGWLDAHVRHFPTGSAQLRVPHVGWNDLEQRLSTPLFTEIPKSSLFYFVHSFYMAATDQGIVAGESEYGCRFASVLTHKAIVAVQFHPEKSQRFGLDLLRNFIERY